MKPLLERTFDVAAVARVMNDPSVRPHIGPGSDEVDPAPFLADLRNIALFGEHGGHLYTWYAPGIYEVHTQFLPAGRNKHALDASQFSVFEMFTKTDCMEIVTRIQAENKAAIRLAEACGFQFLFEQVNRPGWGHMKYYRLDYHRWVQTSPMLPEIGQWFHERLEQQRGSPPGHEDDPAHDRYVGATTAMILCGNVVKGLHTYNRWAQLAGYCQLKVVSEAPLQIHVGDGLIQIEDGTFSVPQGD
ncbi:GNAT family protein [Alcaligenes sp. PF14]|uniref:GNAT family protein n=1 Tax=Alcaligenes sp. PF14 TaxID=3120297 RepID=UPI003017BE1B